MKAKRSKLAYSGPGSRGFWKRVNSLPEPEKGTLYACGVLLQNAEYSVMRWLDNAEVEAASKTARSRSRK